MYDYVLFSKYYCGGKVHKVSKHKYYKTYKYWNEFHVKQIDIPYSHILLDLFRDVSEDDLLKDFIKNIKPYYYHKYTEKCLNKLKCCYIFENILCYLGEIFVCNLYDKNNTYEIPREIIDIDPNVIELYNILQKCKDFKGFYNNVDVLYSFLKQKYYKI